MPTPIETARLRLRPLTLADAAFILELLNDPAFLRYIGDKKVRTIADAEKYLREGPLAMYEKHGLGLLAVERKAEGDVVGMCGLIKRDALADVDIGFAFLPKACGQGYGHESSRAVLAEARPAHGLRRVVAITSPDNEPSMALLRKLGFASEGMIRLSPEADEVRLFGLAV